MKRATLLRDGSSDTVLVPVLRWLLWQLTPEPISVTWADLRALPRPPQARDLSERIALAVRLHPCQLLFVHRDAEAQSPDRRYREVRRANATGLPHVAVVPVRMQEAWLLHDETALRQAAGRPSGREDLGLPSLSRVESVARPKRVLHEALRRASGATGRRAKRFRPEQAAHRRADLVTDWSPLRRLSAFRCLETDTCSALMELGLPLRG